MSQPDPSVPTRTLPSTPTPPAPAPENGTVAADGPPVPATFARPSVDVPGYDVEEELGRGGMGVVYKARHRALGRPAALKMILAGGHAGSAERARFRAEVEAVARLSHPGIVQVYEVGEANGLPWCALELCPGGSLADRLRDGPLAPAAAARLVRQLAQAVQHAHANNIVHRDLKPANVLFDDGGAAKVADFGLAKTADTDAGLTGSGAMMGTPAYMAPEQWTDARRAGPAADVWALGVILWECLTGRRPFVADTQHGVMAKVLNEEPPTPGPGVPLDLAVIVGRCLEKEPVRRFASAEALAEELRRWLDGEPLTVRPVGRAERAAKWVRRNPAVAGLVAAVAFVLMAGAAVATAFGLVAAEQARLARLAEGKEKAAKYDADQRAKDANIEKLQSEKQLAKVERMLVTNKLREALWEWEAGNLEEALGLANECRWDLRGWEHDYVWSIVDGEGVMIDSSVNLYPSVAWSPNGCWIAVTGRDTDGTVELRNTSDGQLGLTLRSDDSELGVSQGLGLCLAWSPEGTRLICGFSKSVSPSVWNSLTGHKLYTLKGHTSEVLTVAWSPDGSRLATGSSDNTAKIWDSSTGREVLSFNGHTDPVCSVAWSPDGRQLITASFDKTVKIWNEATGREVVSLDGHTDEVGVAAWSPDGRQIVTGSKDSTARIWDATTGREVVSLTGHTGNVGAVAWSPDGRQIVTGSADKTMRLWDAKTGRTQRRHGVYSGEVCSVAWSPNGRLLASASRDGHIRLWNPFTQHRQVELHNRTFDSASARVLALSPDGQRIVGTSFSKGTMVFDALTGQTVFALDGHTDEVGVAAWSPDGRQIVTGSKDSTARIWDATTGREVVSLTGHAGEVGAIAWSPDGRQIVTGSNDATARVWDAATGRGVISFKGHASKIGWAAWSIDRKKVVTVSDNVAKVWDAATAREISSLKDFAGKTHSAVWSPDGRRILTESYYKPAKVWDAVSGREIVALQGESGSTHLVAWSPDGQRIAGIWSGGIQKITQVLRIWDATTGAEALSLNLFEGIPTSVMWSHDGKRIRVGSEYPASTCIWESITRQDEMTLYQQRGLHIESLDEDSSTRPATAWSADGKRLLARSDTGDVHAWDAVTGQKLLDTMEEPPRDANRESVGPDGRILRASGRSILITDPHQRRRNEAVSRERLARWALPDPAYHRRNLAAAEAASDWYAAAFHAERLAHLAPGDAAARRKALDLWTKAEQPARAAMNAAVLAVPLAPFGP